MYLWCGSSLFTIFSSHISRIASRPFLQSPHRRRSVRTLCAAGLLPKDPSLYPIGRGQQKKHKQHPGRNKRERRKPRPRRLRNPRRGRQLRIARYRRLNPLRKHPLLSSRTLLQLPRRLSRPLPDPLFLQSLWSLRFQCCQGPAPSMRRRQAAQARLRPWSRARIRLRLQRS